MIILAALCQRICRPRVAGAAAVVAIHSNETLNALDCEPS
jgi:hypothetical protein